MSFCSVSVSEPPHYIYYHQCSRKAATERDGLPLCKQHSKLSRGVWLWKGNNRGPGAYHAWKGKK